MHRLRCSGIFRYGVCSKNIKVGLLEVIVKKRIPIYQSPMPEAGTLHFALPVCYRLAGLSLNSDIQLETTAIFFYRTFIWKQTDRRRTKWSLCAAMLRRRPNRVLARSMYVLADFNCIGLLELHGERSENYNMKHSCPQRDSNSRPLDCQSTTVTVRSSGLMYYRHMKT